MTKHRICPNFETLDTSKISDTTVILDVDGTITADGQSAFTAAVLATITELASRNIVYMYSRIIAATEETGSSLAKWDVR